MRREIEILFLLFLGIFCILIALLRVTDFGLQIFFYILAAMFILAIFRPKESP